MIAEYCLLHRGAPRWSMMPHCCLIRKDATWHLRKTCCLMHTAGTQYQHVASCTQVQHKSTTLPHPHSCNTVPAHCLKHSNATQCLSVLSLQCLHDGLLECCKPGFIELATACPWVRPNSKPKSHTFLNPKTYVAILLPLAIACQGVAAALKCMHVQPGNVLGSTSYMHSVCCNASRRHAKFAMHADLAANDLAANSQMIGNNQSSDLIQWSLVAQSMTKHIAC